jgi:DNA-binding transcriptional ArsR family regulator
MAFSKSFLYPEELRLISHIAFPLSYPGRLRILLKLHTEGTLSVAEIAKDHPISAETLSGHLKILRETQLVTAEEHYPYTYYTIHEKNMMLAEKTLDSFFQFWKQLAKLIFQRGNSNHNIG